MKMRLLPMVLLVSALAVVGLACGSDATSTPRPTTSPPPPAPAPTTAPAPAATPTSVITPAATPTKVASAGLVTVKPEGTLTLGVDVIPVNAIPSALRAGSAYVDYAVMTMLRKSSDGEVLPGIAESWEILPNKIIFKIDRDAQFHDGWGPVTADDIIWSFKDATSQGSIHGNSGELRDVTSYTALDPYTVEMGVTTGNGYYLASRMNHTIVLGPPIHSVKYIEDVGLSKAGRQWIGAGPWKHVKLIDGDQVIYEAVEDHFIVTPEWKDLIVRGIPEPAVALAAVRAGEVDLAPLPPDLFGEASKRGVRIIEGKGGIQMYITLDGQNFPSRALPDDENDPLTLGKFNPDIPWVADPADPNGFEKAAKVRRAMLLAMDRETLKDTLFEGLGFLMVANGFFPGTKWFDPSWEPVPYDPVKAKRLMVEAGYPEGFDMQFYSRVPGRYADSQAKEAIARMWEETLGIKVRRQVYDSNIRALSVKRVLGTDIPTARLAAYNGSYLFPWFFAKAIGTAIADNLLSSEDPFVEELVPRIVIADEPEMIKLTTELGNYYIDNTVVIPVQFIPPLYAVGPRVGDYDHPIGCTDPCFAENISKAK